LITLPELLEDPKYREFFLTVPKTTVPKPGHQPWRLLIQREAGGSWAKKEFEKYADAFRRLAPDLRGGRVHDAAIQSRGIAFAPPTRVARITKGGKPVYQVGADGKRVQKTVIVRWKPRLDRDEEPHTWCTYCRRPTVFRWFKAHHLIRGTTLDGLVDPGSRRCTICGVREEFVATTLGTARLPSYDPRDVRVAGKRARR
jgi:hypothetical protein